MSSHHVIRDEQEPPLIILDDTFDLDIVNQLLGWSPMLIVEASLLKYFQAREIKVDGIIYLDGADQYSKDTTEVTVRYYVEFQKLKLLESINTMLQGKDYTGINIFCNADIRRMLLEELSATVALPFPVNIFVKEEKTFIAFKKVLRKWYSQGQKLSFNTESLACSPPLEPVGNYFQVVSSEIHTFNTQSPWIAITEY